MSRNSRLLQHVSTSREPRITTNMHILQLESIKSPAFARERDPKLDKCTVLSGWLHSKHFEKHSLLVAGSDVHRDWLTLLICDVDQVENFVFEASLTAGIVIDNKKPASVPQAKQVQA